MNHINPRLFETEVSRVARNKLIVAGCALAVMLFLVVANFKFLISCMLGPATMNATELAAIKGRSTAPRTYITVKPDKVFESGVEEVEQRRDKYSNAVKSETKLSSYMLAQVGDKVLTIKCDETAPQQSYTGNIEPLTDELRQAVLGQDKNDPEAQAMLLPYMMDTKSPLTNFYSFLIVVIPTSLLSIWTVLESLKARSNPETGALYKKLNKMGNARELVSNLNSEFSENNHYTLGNMLVSPSWLIHKKPFETSLLRVHDFAWVYGSQETSNSMTSYYLCIWMMDGTLVKLGASDEQRTQVVKAVSQVAPWCMFGYDGSMMLRWNAHRFQILEEIKQERDRVTKAA